MTTSGKQLAKLLIRILLTTVLWIWVFTRDDIKQTFWEAVKAARWQYLVAVWVLTVILFWIRSVKMQLILREQSCDVGVATIFRSTVVTCLYSMIMPGMLSSGVKWYILKRSTGKGSNVLSSMLYNQLSMTTVMTVFGLAALMIGNPTSQLMSDTRNQWLLPVVCGMLLIAVVLVTFLLLSKRAGGRAIEALRFLLGPLPKRMRQKGLDMLDQIAIFQTSGWRFHLIVALMTVIDSSIGAFAVYVLAARSANITAPATVFMWLCAVTYVLGRLPISVANLGVREVTLVGFLAVYGVDKSAALLMSMILFSALVFMAIIGAMFQSYWALAAKKTAGV
jgi:hypothetical protein